MTWLGFGLSFCLLLFLSSIFSGSETGIYSLSRVRVHAEARLGRPSARMLSRLLDDDSRLLITLLIGNNLMLELATQLLEARLTNSGALPAWSEQIVVALLLTPFVFLFGELLPKDLFRQRPHTFLGISAPVLVLARYLLLPLSLPLQALSWSMERLIGLERHGLARALGREELVEIFSEGRREGTLEPEAAELAHNVLGLRATPISKVMTPWDRAVKVELSGDPGEVRRQVAEGAYTRVPAYDKKGADRVVVGYLHQLDVLCHGRRGEKATTSPAHPGLGVRVRPLASLPPDLPVDRALARMRVSGERLALVGDPAHPQGLVTLMDLVATISGGLVG